MKISLRTPIFLLGLIAIITMNNCASLPAYEGVVRRADAVMLYEVEKFAVDPMTQTAGVQYVGNYKVVKNIALDESQQRSLKSEVLNVDNYAGDDVKSCPHVASYAIEFRYKDKVDFTMVISWSPCAKAYVTTKAGKEELIDLVPNGVLEQLVGDYAGI